MALNLKKLSFKLEINGVLQQTQDLSTAEDVFHRIYNLSFTNGAGANQAHQWWHDTRSLAATTAENHDLSGDLDSAFSTNIAGARLKGIIIIHKTPAASSTLSVGGHATAALNTIFSSVEGLDTDQPKLKVRPGGWLVMMAPDATGYVITATTEDLLTVTNDAAASVDYDIFLLIATS